MKITKNLEKTLRVLENIFIEQFLPQVLEKRVMVEIIDKHGNTLGFITEKSWLSHYSLKDKLAL